jgi:glyoxylase-like metal-dependent hydrolase (beta-lactamase superfamily II)
MDIAQITVGAFGANCYIVWADPLKAVVIDPGADAPRIRACLEDNRLTVTAYMLTHGHVDHISAAADLCETHPAPVGLHRIDTQWAFEEATQMPPFYPPPGKPSDMSRVFGDAAAWSDGGLEYEALLTPGHTPGSVCFFFRSENSLFSGDTLFAGSVGRSDLPGGDSRQLAASLKALRSLPDDVTVYPGHGPATTIGREKRTNIFMQSNTAL